MTGAAARRHVPERFSLADFVEDQPFSPEKVRPPQALPFRTDGLIDGVVVDQLTSGRDDRGSLNELLTTREGAIAPIVHVYQVFAVAGSIHAWAYHARQSDRLCFTNGMFRVVLYDIREGSRTFGQRDVLHVGEKAQCCITIPPFVIHGAMNEGSTLANFVSCPTSVYLPSRPDKFRLRHGHPGIPYRFE